MKDTKIQWHPGFVAAIDLEFADNRKDLIYEKEYNLNTKPLEIDLLVIKKNSGITLNNEIGKLFKGHNIMEYKSPEDSLDIDAFYKAAAYACLYKSYGETSDERKAEDITISILRESKPEGLFGYFKEHNIKMSNPHHGIYYVLDGVLFPTQIIATKELDKKNHTWLKALSGKLKEQDIKELLKIVSKITRKYDRELADSVLEVSVSANNKIVEKLRGEDAVCKALLEIMEPEIKEITRKSNIVTVIESLRECSYGEDKIKEHIMKKFQLPDAEAKEYLSK